MCNVFKPERCHHCSACNRCVLNMDHHCPWINNCVGFWNRKYFMLLLFYTCASTYFVVTTLAFDFVSAIKWGTDAFYYSRVKADQQVLIRHLAIILVFFFTGMLSCLVTMFTRFHIRLLYENKTTIENLEKKGKTYTSQVSLTFINFSLIKAGNAIFIQSLESTHSGTPSLSLLKAESLQEMGSTGR